MILRDKVAIITGGSGGIGCSIVRKFLEEGARVVVADIEEQEVRRFAAELGQKDRVLSGRVDVSDVAEVNGLIENCLKEFGDVDILVNAAGIQGPIGRFVDVDLNDWIKNLEINLIGTVICCKTILPIFMKKGDGRIVNFAGGGANFPRPNFTAYGVAKAAVVRFTETLAEELRPHRIRINAVSPGVVKTRMIEDILRAGEDKAGGEVEQIRGRFQTGFDSPELVAELVCYLVSEESSGLTGKVISAVWDPWKEWQKNKTMMIDKDMYVLRRIDGRNYLKGKG